MDEPAPAPLLPPLLLASYLACLTGAAALANCAVIAALLKRSNTGLFSIIIQLSIADLILLATTFGPELWSYNKVGAWDFGNNGCKAYKGLNVLATTASLYFVITISLHTTVTVNLYLRNATRKNKLSKGIEEEEIRSSRHSLVANSDSSTPPRTMNVDYRLPVTSIPVTTPTVFVWILSASLSVPEFVLASTVPLTNSTVFCTLLDTTHKLNMQTLLAIFDLFIPFIVICFVFVLIILKLKSNFTHLDSAEYMPSLKLSLGLIIVYILMCSPRAIDNVYRVYLTLTFNDKPQANDHDTNDIIQLLFSAIYLASTLVRPLLCILILPQLKRKLSYT